MKSKLEKKIDKDYEKLIDLIHSIIKKQSKHLLINFTINELRNGHSESDYAFSISVLTVFKVIANNIKNTNVNSLFEVRNLIITIEKIFEQNNFDYFS